MHSLRSSKTLINVVSRFAALMFARLQSRTIISFWFGLIAILAVPFFGQTNGIAPDLYYPATSICVFLVFVLFSRFQFHTSTLCITFALYVLASGIIDSFSSGVVSIQRTFLLLFSFSPMLFYGRNNGIHGKDCFGIHEVRNNLESSIEKVIYFVCIFSAWQVIANGLDLPLSSDFLGQRGRGAGWSRQVSGFFSEPAFLAMFLVFSVYFCLFCRSQENVKLAVVIVLVSLVSGSVSAVTFTLALFAAWLITKPDSLISVRGIAIVVAMTGIIWVNFGLVEKVYYRVNSEVFSNFVYIGGGVNLFESGSGAIRVINELNVALLAISRAPILGLGPEYEMVIPGRSVAANAIVEILVRYGIVGVVIFLGIIFVEKFNYPPKAGLPFSILVISLSLTDGAIAKPYLWIYLSLIFAIERKNEIIRRSAGVSLGCPKYSNAPIREI